MNDAAAAALFQTALQHYQQRNMQLSEQALLQLVAARPTHFDALHLLGVIAAQTGRRQAAIDYLSRAIRQNGEVAAVHFHLGNVQRDCGELAAALASYDRAVALRADFREAYVNRAMVLLLSGRHEPALANFDRAIALGLDNPVIQTYRASALINLQRPAEALTSADRALASQPTMIDALLNRAGALQALQRHDEAISACDAVLALQPGNVDALVRKGAALNETGRLEAALACVDQAIALQPANPMAHHIRAGMLLGVQRFAEALPSTERAITLSPEFAEAHNNHGLALRDVDLAIASFERAIALRPNVGEPYFNKATRLLQAGRFDEGWALYEYRHNRLRVPPSRERPVWSGREDIAGKTVFTYSEQGLGDTIQFCRYVRLLQARGARVILAVQDNLRELTSSLGPDIRIVGAHEVPENFDFQVPLLSLPCVFQTRLDSVPAEVPYLHAQGIRVDRWQQMLGTAGRRIGICWQGSTGKMAFGRSFPLAMFRDIARLRGVRLVSLQRGAGSEQLQDLPTSMEIVDLGADFDAGAQAFLDTAAVIECLDLVITCDTAVAHLAGALGRPTWVALQHHADWRWLLDCEHSPWYPSVRLFRQQRPGDWQEVFDRIRHELANSTAPAP